jgi:hypothetical protein
VTRTSSFGKLQVLIIQRDGFGLAQHAGKPPHGDGAIAPAFERIAGDGIRYALSTTFVAGDFLAGAEQAIAASPS